MASASKPLSEFWWQTEIPVIFNRGKNKRPWVKIGQSFEDYKFIKLNRTHPEWIAKYKCYQVPRIWMDKLVRKLVDAYGSLYVIQPYREMEVCSGSCKTAKGHDCECQCLGQHHGVEFAGNDWFEISEACEIRWGEKRWACRLLESSKQRLLRSILLV